MGLVLVLPLLPPVMQWMVEIKRERAGGREVGAKERNREREKEREKERAKERERERERERARRYGGWRRSRWCCRPDCLQMIESKSDAGYAVLPLTLLGAPADIGNAANSHMWPHLGAPLGATII